MVGAYRRRRRDELYAMGITVNLAVGKPKQLEREIAKLIPDIEPKPRRRMQKWWGDREWVQTG